MPENLFPEALTASCSVCKHGDVTPDNDLALCDRCDQGFHAKCHDPVVPFFGHPEDQWFCSTCTLELCKMRGLKHKAGCFVWAESTAPWPARILRIDFTSLADPKPYWVEFFDTGPHTGKWVSEAQVVAWEDGPAYGSIKDARRRLGVRLAEAAGAEPISGNAKAPLQPIPASRAAGSARVSAPSRCFKATPAPKRPRRAAKSPEAKSPEVEDDNSELSKQVDEMRSLIEAARERQRRLELEIEQAAAASQAGA